MRVETLKSLIGATLLSSPAITSIENIVFDAKKVQRGDLFFAYEYDSIGEAVQNGAYAIIVDRVVEIIDPEIAWLRVDSLKECSIKLLRYHLEQINKEFVLLDSFEFEILSQISLSKQVQFLHNTQKDIFTIFDPNKQIFLSDDASFLKSFCKEYQDLSQIHNDKKSQIIRSSLYESSFIYDETYYKNIALAPFYIDHFLFSLEVAHKLKIQYNEQKLGFCDFFYPQFLNQNCKPVEFGKGSKVLLFCADVDLVQNYCQKNLRHLKITHFQESDLNLLQERLKQNDIVITSKLQRGIMQMSPFIQTNDTPTLF